MKQTSNADAGAVKLLPCPFCGGDVKLIQGFEPLDDSFFVDCQKCEMSGQIVSTKDAAIAAWNRCAPTAEQAEVSKSHLPALNGLTSVPCAVGMDQGDRYYGWVFIPHVDGQWVTAAKLDPFTLKVIEHWKAAQAVAAASTGDQEVGS